MSCRRKQYFLLDLAPLGRFNTIKNEYERKYYEHRCCI